MRLTDNDEELMQIRRELAYLFRPAEARHAESMAHMPQAYLIDFYGPQLTVQDGIAATHDMLTLIGEHFNTDDAMLYRIDDDMHRYTRGISSLSARMSYEKDFQVALQQYLPENPLFCFSVGNVFASLMSWAFEDSLHALRATDIQRLMGALYLVLEPVGINLPEPVED